ncbi:hypothetical protein KMZ27_26615 [Pseudomonas shirazica]|nr:hypothetical protein [Pseudomonas shirazica]
MEKLLSDVYAYDQELNDKEVSPDGDSYNDLLHMVTLHLSAMTEAARGGGPLHQGGTAQPVEAAPAVVQPVAATGSLVAVVLAAIVGRLSLSNIRSILQAFERCSQEQLNGNANSQLIAGKALSTVISQGVDAMVASDRKYLESLLAPQA